MVLLSDSADRILARAVEGSDKRGVTLWDVSTAPVSVVRQFDDASWANFVQGRNRLLLFDHATGRTQTWNEADDTADRPPLGRRPTTTWRWPSPVVLHSRGECVPSQPDATEGWRWSS